MLNAVIIEDERPALESLLNTLSSVTDDVQVTARLGSVKESIEFLSQPNAVDLIFSDVQLSDGLSFEIFNKGNIRIPVIFITGYDEFMLNAFEYNGIDYLLKPVDKESLSKALVKYKMLEKHFTNHHSLANLMQYIGNHKKRRMIVKKGMENISLRLDDVVLFYTENKIVYVLDRWGKKYLADKNLAELEDELDEATFFRANRQCIINIDSIVSVKPLENSKLVLTLKPPIKMDVDISREKAPLFKKWMDR